MPWRNPGTLTLAIGVPLEVLLDAALDALPDALGAALVIWDTELMGIATISGQISSTPVPSSSLSDRSAQRG